MRITTKKILKERKKNKMKPTFNDEELLLIQDALNAVQYSTKKLDNMQGYIKYKVSQLLEHPDTEFV